LNVPLLVVVVAADVVADVVVAGVVVGVVATKPTIHLMLNCICCWSPTGIFQVVNSSY